MLPIIEENRPIRSSDRFAQAFSNFGQSLGQELPQYLMGREQERKESALAKKILGEDFDLEGVSPDFKKAILEHGFKEKEKSKKHAIDTETNEKVYEAIKNRFGEEKADIYSAATEGGKTKLLGQWLEDESRITPAHRAGIMPEEDIEPSAGFEIQEKEEPEFKTKDFDKGLTPKERVQRQNERYRINQPLFQESQEKRQALDQESDLLDILEELSPQISFFERLNINPSTGDLIIPALGTSEAQRYVKTINEFTRNAKDTYGSRVTNFDLSQFMKRLPTLANSEEGRRQIVQQMKIINNINKAYNDSLNKIVDSYGGIRNIDWDQAQQFAEKESKGKISKLKNEFKNISKNVDRIYKDEIEDRRKKTPNGYVIVDNGQGDVGYVPKENLKSFLEDNPGSKAL